MSELVWIQNLKALVEDGMFRTDERWKKIFIDRLNEVNEASQSAATEIEALRRENQELARRAALSDDKETGE